MTLSMYRSDIKSRVYLYIILVTAAFLGWTSLVFLKPLIIVSECSDMASRTSFLSKRYNIDLGEDYDYQKAVCLSEAFGK